MKSSARQPMLFDADPPQAPATHLRVAGTAEAPPSWATGTVSIRLTDGDNRPLRESCPAWIVDGLAVHVVHWCWGDAKEPRYTLTGVASGYGLHPHYLEMKLPRAKDMARRVVELPDWATVRDCADPMGRRDVRDALSSIANHMGGWLDWPYGWDRVPIRPGPPATREEAVERYRSAKGSWLAMAWNNPTLAHEYRILAGYARADLAGMIGPSSYFDCGGRRYQVGPDGVMVDDEMGMTGIEIPRDSQ